MSCLPLYHLWWLIWRDNRIFTHLCVLSFKKYRFIWIKDKLILRDPKLSIILIKQKEKIISRGMIFRKSLLLIIYFYLYQYIFYHKCRFSYITSMAQWPSLISHNTPQFKNFFKLLVSQLAELCIKELISIPLTHSKTMPTFTLQVIWMVARRRRKRKFTQLRRKINIFTNELKWASTVSTQSMVHNQLYRQRKRNSNKKDLPFMRTWYFHGTALG